MNVERVEIGPHVLYRADCLAVLPMLATASVDAVVTDPPYGIVNKFGENIGRPGHGNPKMQFAWDDASKVPEAVREAVRKADAAFVFCGFNTIEPVQNVLRESGLMPKPWVWVKTCPPPPLPGNWWPSAFESAIYAYRSGAWFGDDDPCRRNVYIGDTLRNGNSEKNGHPTQKPLHLMQHIVGSIVPPDGCCIDPFMGSGTTGVACVRTGRRFIGVEIEPRYFDIACRRIEEAWGKGSLFDDARKPEPAELFAETWR